MTQEPKPRACHVCSGVGYRGMDRCNWCDTTGSVFIVGDERFPNTKEGYTKAIALLKSLQAGDRP